MDSQPPKPRLQEQFRSLMRAHHYSIRTEKSYWYWIRFYLRFHQMGTSKNYLRCQRCVEKRLKMLIYSS